MTTALHVDHHSFHDLRVGDRRVLLHIPSNGLFDLDPVSADVLDFLKERDHISADQVQERFTGQLAADAVADALRDLRDLGVVGAAAAAAEADEGIAIDEFPLSTIVLNVNTGCNLSCSYCYKEDLASPAAGEKLDADTAKRAVDLLLVQGAARKRLSIIYFGGEPLSNMALIRTVTDYAERRCREAGKEVDFSLTTNATLLTEDIADYLDAHRFGISVSIDGPEAIHDRRRLTIGGHGTYAVVAAKARMLLSRYRSRPVGARVTLSAGCTDVGGIHRHLKDELGFAEVGFAPVTSGPISTFNLEGEELRQVFESMKRLGRRYLDAAVAGHNIGFSNMNQLLADLYEGRRKALPCGAGVGLLAVDGQGDLHLCHRFTGSSLPRFGNVDTGIDKPGLGAFLRTATQRSDKSCATCRIRNLCAGGCYHESYARFDDPHSPVYHYCELLRDWADFGIEVYLELLEKNPQFLHQHIGHRREEA